MAEIVKLPNLGMNMQEATFLNWLKEVGETVSTGDVLAEVEADKATIEVQATATGILTTKLVNPGDTVTVGQDIAKLSSRGESTESEAPDLDKSADTRPIVAPLEERAKAQPTPGPAPAAAASAPAPVPAQSVTEPGLSNGVKASPLARRLAEEKGVDLKLVTGTGPGGRITKTDVESFKAAPAPQPAEPAQPTSPAPATPAPRPIPQVNYGTPNVPDYTEEPISRMRQRIAQRTVESKQQVPHFYLTIEVDMAAAVALRKQINEGLPEEQKVSVNDMIVKAVALTLRKFPNLNSHYYGDKIVRHNHINIGIAVALEKGGLLNVVAKNADIVSISRLAQHNKEMIASARSGKVRPEDLEGSTFTVSNLGPYNVEHFEAIINPPEAAILAVSSAREVPVVINGEIKIGNRMKATLSVDHRVSDGAEGAQFMAEFRAILENPMRLLV